MVLRLLQVFVIRFLLTPSCAEGVQCGEPGKPANGTFSPSGRNYFPGEKVTYSCLEGFVLFGDEGRTCLKNGTWSGKVPLCDFNLAKGKRTLQSATLWSYIPSLAVDGNRGTCSFTPKGPEPRWWQVHLGHKFNVVAIGVTISPGSFQEFTIFVIELLSNNKALYKPCTEFKGVFQTHKGLFKCNDGLGHPGQYVYIRDDREEEQYFGLCEVEVFAFRERIPCGEPEIPIKGTVNRIGEEKAIYGCDAGHTLKGDDVLMCSSKGEWQGEPPRCKEVLCDAPPLIENGFIEVGNPGENYSFGIEASYSCSTGYMLLGPKKRVCGQDGEWSQEAPACQAVTCGDPPVFNNTKFTFLNDTNSHLTGIVIYTCLEGFKLHSESEETISTCLATGSWRSINVTCVPFKERVELIVRETEGRSLDYKNATNQPDSSSDLQLIITLAVVAGILAIGMLIFGVLLLRRRLVPGSTSLSPLFPNNDSPDKTNSVVENEESTPPSYKECTSKPSNQFHSNLLQGITNADYRTTRMSYSSSEISGMVDPHYEQVHSRYDHNYESLKSKKNPNICDGNYSNDTTYESSSSDKESVGYETVLDTKEPGYEVVNNKEPGYEVVIDGKEPGYEVVKDKIHKENDKESGYETILNRSQEPGYEIVKDSSNQVHGYETLKPKLPPRIEEKECDVPDILQNISLKRCSKDTNKDETNPSTKDVDPEILALYAKVDKSKKIRKPKPDSSTQNNSVGVSGTFIRNVDNSSEYSDKSERNSEEPTSLTNHPSISSETSISSSMASSGSSLRPLPPLPR